MPTRPTLARTAACSTIALLVGLLAACGSQIDPEAEARANGFVIQQAGPAAGAGPGAVAGGESGAGTPGDVQVPGAPAAPGIDTGEPGSSDPTGSDGGAAGQEEPTEPTGDAPKGACDGFANSLGITDDTITLGNAADISGPQPGVFEASQDAARAYVAYFNATSDICGHKLELTTYDTRTDGGAEQQAYAAACDEVFAMVGSMSAFDSAGAGQAAACGLPDIRTAGITPERITCSTSSGLCRPTRESFRTPSRTSCSTTTATPASGRRCSTSTSAPPPTTRSPRLRSSASAG